MIEEDKKMRRAVFFDIDGTILDSMNGKVEMTPAVSAAIRKLQEEGDYVFIATGRPASFITEYLRGFGFDGFLLNNGAHIIMGEKVLYKDALDRQFVKAFTTELDQAGIQYILQGEKCSYLNKEFTRFQEFFAGLSISEDRMKREFNIDEIEVMKIEVLCGSEEIEARCKAVLEHYPEYEYFFSVSNILLEVHAKKNTKGKGILRVLESLDIPLSHSYAFGDGGNDKDMLKTVGCGIAMGNASDEVKSYADCVTTHVHEDGVAEGIYRYILAKQEDSKELCS